jgi:hypothetical protein
VTYNARLWLGQAWALVFLAAISAALAGPARAQGPDPVPAPTHTKALRPEPAPSARPKAASSRPTNSSTVTTVQSRTARSPIVVTPPAPIAPQPAFTPARVQRARVEPPKKPTATKPQRARAPSKKAEVKWTLGARERLGAAVDSSPDGMLLAGGLALFVLLLGETIFLTLSVRFLRRTT